MSAKRLPIDVEHASVSALKSETRARKETFYPGPSGSELAAFPPKERWDDWVELDSKSWPRKKELRQILVPTTCFNCESACGLLAYIDKETLQVRKFEGNPEHPGSRGRNCAKGPATLNQVQDVDRILYPLKRVGKRGSGRFERVSWDVALDDIAGRIRKALVEKRPNDIMYHVGRPGEDGYTERVLAAWGVDGHNSHTNICSSAARAGYQFWMGFDRPSPDHANADVILLISAHLESGHYFNPHAQRIMDGKQKGAKLIVMDVRLSNTATHADHWIAPYPGSEAAILLAMASYILQNKRHNREFMRKFWNWEQYLAAERPELPRTFESFETAVAEAYASYTFEFAAAESGVDAGKLREIAEIISKAGTKLAAHNWRSAAAGAEGGWQVARTLFFLNCLLGAVACEGGTYPNTWNKFVPKPIYMPPHPKTWNELTWPKEFPLAMYEMSILLPHFLREGRGKLDVYFSRVYNAVWTNPDGFSWIDQFTRDDSPIGLHVALTPTWSETAYFADYILPMGVGSERHDLHSYETQDAQWIGFRQPVLKEAKRRLRKDLGGTGDTRAVNPGEVWEENEMWIDLSWRIDPDGSLGIRKFFESKKAPGAKLGIDEYYDHIFNNSVPGLPEKAAAEDLSAGDFMRRYGAYEIRSGIGQLFAEEVPASELVDVARDGFGRVYAGSPKPDSLNVAPQPVPDSDAAGRRPVGIDVDGRVLRGFPTPSGRLEFYSPTLKAWGYPEAAIPTYLKSHVHPENLLEGELPLIPTFRIPIQIHTRSGNSKWLAEIAHSNPLWIHTSHAERLGVSTGDLVRVSTRIGHFIVKAWVTEGIKPGVVACSHHMGRWKLEQGEGQRQAMATVSMERNKSAYMLRRLSGVEAHVDARDTDLSRVWWTDAGVHQNLTFPVQPDPISGMHCWHQAVRVEKAREGDRYGDISVDLEKSKAHYEHWMAKSRSATKF
ncbi:MAG: molybdopterin-dependent oxidoreductase, partial [Vicinamibacteria bacterium]